MTLAFGTSEACGFARWAAGAAGVSCSSRQVAWLGDSAIAVVGLPLLGRTDQPWDCSEVPRALLGTPCDPRLRSCAVLASCQSTFSTLPMIFSSKMGRTAASSRTSSNTTPQSNSSLTFLK